MGLFFKDSIKNLEKPQPQVMIEPMGLSYNEVMDYLVSLPEDEYEKLLKVTNIYRRAERQVSDVLHPNDDVLDQPTTGPAPAIDNSETTELDEIVEEFLETDKQENKDNGSQNG